MAHRQACGLLAILVLTGALLPVAAQEETPTTTTAPAPTPNLTVVRVESLEALTADIVRLSALVGAEISGDAALDPVAQMLGISDLSWVDRKRPLVAVMPSSAMLLGAKGVLAAVPVTDAQAAIEAMGGMFPRAEHGEDGIHQFFTDEENSILVAAREDNYLVIGSARNLVVDFDHVSALGVTELPPGSVAIDIFLEPVAPMAIMGLQAGRQMAIQKLEEEAQSGDDEDVDPQAMAPFLDFYFNLIENIVNNTSRLQLSFEIGAEHLLFHKRLVPRSGSTLSGLLAAQRGGLPELASYIDPGDGAVVYAGQISWTPAFLEAMRSFLDDYAKAMTGLADHIGKDEETAPFAASMRLGLSQAGQWLDCYRGDAAGTYDLDTEHGLRVTQVSGVSDPEGCQKALSGLIAAVRELPDGPDGKPFVEVTENALTYGGVSALQYRMSMPTPSGADDVGKALFSAWFGGGGMISLTGLKGDLMLGAAGKDADSGFRGLVDRTAGGKRAGGIGESDFAPLRVGPGMFVAFDVHRLVGSIASLLTEGEDDKLRVFLDSLPEKAAHVVLGSRLDTSAVSIDLALPLGMLEAIGATVAAQADEQETTAEAEPQG